MLLALWPSVAFAVDPLTLFLLRMLRDQIISSGIETAIEGVQRNEPQPVLVIPPAPYDLDDRKLRTLIDEGFVHLSSAQREEVFASVKRVLSDPKNAAMRPYLVQELAIKASAVRQAHERLTNLSQAQKRAIAAEARTEYEKLPPDERRQMFQVLQSGVVPLPRDLNEMILAEFGSVQAMAGAP
ncbi:MAG: hypothetical protein A3F74_24570 [Betaproteobacteria bacterium RIFCSPLOWO2_12_FULL_62_58]|nr:MAG: hypothetical protein A3F74_24570 [Betaproteobacteria bacterium RIFCSPLOWO2_12_FULL_62_58]